MKRIITILSLFLAISTYSQITYLPMPEGYGYWASYGTIWVPGGSQIGFQEGNYLYGVTSKLVEGSTTQYEGFIFKYDTANNTTTIFSGQVLPVYSYLVPCNFTNFNNHLYFNHQQNLYRIDLSSGVVSQLLTASYNYIIKNNKLYSFGGSNATGSTPGSIQLKVLDFSTNIVTTPYYVDTISGLTYEYYFSSYALSGDMVYFYGFNYSTTGGFRRYKLFKMDNMGNLFIVHDYNNASNGSNESPINDDYNYHKRTLPILNNQLLVYKNSNPTGIEKFDISTNVYTPSAYSGNFGINNQTFIADGWLYFKDSNGIVHKTNGLDFSETSLPSFFSGNGSGGEAYEPVVLYNNSYYGQNSVMYKSDLTAAGTYSISSTHSFYFGKVFNDKLIFLNSSSNTLTSYDGNNFTSLVALNFSLANNNRKVNIIGNNLYVNGYKHNLNLGYYDCGIYKIDLSTLGITENEPQTITFYPNPIVSNITFSRLIAHLEVFDVSGKKVKMFVDPHTTFNLSDLQKGIYFLKGKTNEEIIFNEKVIKN